MTKKRGKRGYSLVGLDLRTLAGKISGVDVEGHRAPTKTRLSSSFVDALDLNGETDPFR